MNATGQRLYIKAKHRIPGGTQLLSKRPEMILPDHWPAYYSRARGVNVWDLDERCYVDMSTNGLGSCILGAADPDVDRAVRAAVDGGSMSTLNCPEEVELAELLCDLHPWAEKVRYARCGGEPTPAFYATYAHEQHHVDSYLEAVGETFHVIAQATERNAVEQSLRGPVAHSGFRRLT